jgi:phosphoglycolate phosphatase
LAHAFFFAAMNYKLIIFDLDGTLVDSKASIMAAMRDMAVAMGLSQEEFAQKPVNIGLPMSDILRGFGIADIEAARSVYRQQYRKYTHMELAFPGVTALLEKLYGRVPLAIATNKAYEGSLRTLGNAGITKYFDFIASLDQGTAKPDPDAFNRICTYYRSLGRTYSPQECLMIGDSPIDCEFARNCGIDFVFAQWGFHDGGGLPESIRTVSRPADLIELLV